MSSYNKKFEVKTKGKYQPKFKDVHPTSTAGKMFQGRDLRAWGGSEGLESDFIACVQCGFINDVSVTALGSGYGNITSQAVSGSDALEPVSTSGCRLCGSSNWIGGQGDGDFERHGYQRNEYLR